MPIRSDILPWSGGIIAPPRIIMIRNAEPCVWNLPSPASEREKIQGHIIEQNNPVLKKEYTANRPLVFKPIIVEATPNVEKTARV